MRRIDGVVAFRGGGFAPRERTIAGVATLVGLIALWQLGCSLGVIRSLFLPAPITIATSLYQLAVSGELWRQISPSLMRLAIG